MSLGAVLKRHKRTLMSFQNNFLIPFINKAAWRYMQFDPESYPVGDYKFNAQGSLGVIAREYEVGQLVQLLQTVPADSPLYPTLLNSIIDNMNLSNRETLLEQLAAANAPNPEEQQKQQALFEKEVAVKDATIASLKGTAAEAAAHAKLYSAQADDVPIQSQIKMVDAATDSLQPGDGDDKEFERRLTILRELREERKVDFQEKQLQANIDQQKAAQAAAQNDAAQLEQALNV